MSKVCFTRVRYAKKRSFRSPARFLAAHCLRHRRGLGSGGAIIEPRSPVKNRLKNLRTAKEWSQGELAERLGVSRQTINAIETEKYDPSLPLAFKIARLFSRKIEDIFDDRG